MFKSFLSFIFVLFVSNLIFGQGTVKGKVIDGITGEPLAFAKVKVEGLNAGANSDFDGNYTIKIAPGTYTLIFSLSMDGYINIKKEIVLSTEPLTLDVALLKDKTMTVATMTVTHVVNPKTIAGSDGERMEGNGATDGVSGEQMAEQGVTNVSDALQSAPGISIEDGKNVYVRGLGDRYTKTLLNGMEIPGLDPNRNSVQLDIFPATLIDNITIFKSFTPDLTGDFTGGLVDIKTKDYPNKKTMYAKLGLGFNTKATFNSEYLTYKGGATDFLGFDDGARALPVRTTDVLLSPIIGDSKLETMTKSFSKVMAPEAGMAFLDQNYTFSYGDKVKIDTTKRKLEYGYNLAVNYRNSNRYYDDIQFSEYRKVYDNNGDPVTNLDRWRQSNGQLAENNVLLTGLISQGLKFKRSKLSLVIFHTQNGNSSSSIITEGNFEQNPSTLVKQNIQYSQRSVTNANFSGVHYLDKEKVWKLEWKASPTFSRISDPDMRSTALELLDEKGTNGEDVYAFSPAVGSEIRRTWRELREYNVGGRFDVSRKFASKDSLKDNHEISFGGLNTYKTRSFEVYDYFFDRENSSEFSGDPDWYFQDQNIWTAQSDSGTYAFGQKEPANTFNAAQNVNGLYALHVFPISEKLKATYGARVEKVTNWYTGQNNNGTVFYDNEIVLDEWNVLPSVNLVYQMERKSDSTRNKRTTNLRGAYFMTLARPSFKEKSIAQIYDPIQGRTFNGNIDLLQTTVHNIDVRWEHFFGNVELVSASAFYKRFNNPIELVAFNSAPNEIQPLNAGTADVLGFEVELRKSLVFGKKRQEKMGLILGTNFTYVKSRIDMREVQITTGTTTLTEKEIREANAREDEEIGNFRPMNGQSPFMVNAFLTYKDTLGWTVNLSYNVQGKKLAIIGIESLPDVYEQSFHSLYFKASKTFGSNGNWTGSLTANNLLMSVRQKHYESYGAESQIYDYYNRGMTISGSVSHLIVGNKDKKSKKSDKKKN
ncbi:MAG: carboxypeptidase-like regulatory domain-containing protein [Crocinitomicaceae bacterium]